MDIGVVFIHEFRLMDGFGMKIRSFLTRFDSGGS